MSGPARSETAARVVAAVGLVLSVLAAARVADLPGWQESTVGVKTLEQLPKNARAYLERIEKLCRVPIDLVSTGPDREETIVRRHPFDPS